MFLLLAMAWSCTSGTGRAVQNLPYDLDSGVELQWLVSIGEWRSGSAVVD